MESVIDLTFSTTMLKNRIVFCGTEPQEALQQDHIPIRIQIDLAEEPQAPRQRFALAKLNVARLIHAVTEATWDLDPSPLEALQSTVHKALQEHCPLARPSRMARRNWSPRATELIADARRARSDYHRTLHGEDLQRHKALSNLLKKELCRGSRNN